MSLLKNKNFLILDDDQVVLKMTESHFKSMGASEIFLFETVADAWSCCKKNNIDGFILDWELGSESSHGLFSRIRSHQELALIPIIVICRQMNRSDLTLIDEFPCTSFLQKPFTSALVTNTMSRLLLEKEQFEKYQALIDSFMDISGEDIDKAMDYYKKILKKFPDNRTIQILAARTFRTNGHLEQALSILEEILEKDNSSLPALTEIAKIHYEMGKHDVCLNFLKSAIEISPQNFERILLAGQAHTQRFEVEEASGYFNDALAIDADSKSATLGLTTCKNMDAYFKTHGYKGVPGNLASLLNIIGVNFVRSKDIVSAIDQYTAAFDFAQSAEDKARVAFNLGLGYLRGQDSIQAGEWFTKSIEIHPVCKDKASDRLRCCRFRL